MADPVLLTFNEQIYSVEAIQKAAYRSMNTLVADISIRNGQIQCAVQPTLGTDPSVFEYGIQEFKKEILDQQLRLKLKAETEPVRNLILGIAFSRTGLQGGE